MGRVGRNIKREGKAFFDMFTTNKSSLKLNDITELSGSELYSRIIQSHLKYQTREDMIEARSQNLSIGIMFLALIIPETTSDNLCVRTLRSEILALIRKEFDNINGQYLFNKEDCIKTFSKILENVNNDLKVALGNPSCNKQPYSTCQKFDDVYSAMEEHIENNLSIQRVANFISPEEVIEMFFDTFGKKNTSSPTLKKLYNTYISKKLINFRKQEMEELIREINNMINLLNSQESSVATQNSEEVPLESFVQNIVSIQPKSWSTIANADFNAHIFVSGKSLLQTATTTDQVQFHINNAAIAAVFVSAGIAMALLIPGFNSKIAVGVFICATVAILVICPIYKKITETPAEKMVQLEVEEYQEVKTR